jgi:hypothetical protein
MKKALYWAVRPTMYGPRIVAVTQERSGRWWGRTTHDDLGTHGRLSDIRGRFETIEAAQAVQSTIQRVRDHYQSQSAVVSDLQTKLHRAEEALTREIIDGSPKRGAALLFVSASLHGGAPSDDLGLYQLAFGRMTREELEWCGERTGQGSGPHGSGNDGTPCAACPVCGGLREPNGEFIASAVGHTADCAMAAALGRKTR